MKIHLTFGQGLDSARWSKEDASLGCQTLGLTGMRDFLEHKLGILDKEPVPAVRIAQYQRKLREYYKKNPGTWGAESFKKEKDPWSTAKQLLAWRDELIEGGWNKTYNGDVSERLTTLAAVEKTGPELDPGPSDRLREVLKKLKSETNSWPVEVTLAHPQELFPPVWRQILDELKKVVSLKDAPCENEKVETLLEGKDVIQLEGNSHAELARHLVRYLTAAKNSGELSSITLLACGDTRVLDGALHKGGFGAVGKISSSAGRPSQALLMLFFSVMWKPIRVEQLYELIASPYLGIPNKNLIRGAIENAPGVGSEEWNQAWDNALTGGENNEKYKGLREWLENPLEKNASASDLIERCDWLQKRLEEQKGYPELGKTLSALDSLKSALEQSDGESFTLIQLARAIESAIGSGTPPANTEREATKFKIVTNPGMVEPIETTNPETVESTETLLWFDCVRSDPPRPTRWSKGERQYFEAANVTTDTAERRRKLDAYYRKRAFKNTSQRIIFFVPKTIDGEEADRATFLNEVDLALIKTLGKKNAEKHKIKAESLIKDSGHWELKLDDQILLSLEGDTESIRGGMEVRYDTGILGADNADAKITPRLFTIKNLNIGNDYRFSYSQLSNLLSCPMRWVIENYLALKDYVPVQFNDHSVKGKLAHDVLEELVKNRKSWDLEEARKLAGERFDELVKERGGTLNNKENAIERKNLRRTIVDMAVRLFEQLRDWKVQNIATEQDINDSGATFAGYPVSGRIDILVEGEKGEKHILDLKNSSKKYYYDPSDEQYNITVLQLAIYLRLVDETSAKAAFALIPKRRILDEQDSAALSKTITDAEVKIKDYLDKLQNGELVAADKPGCEKAEYCKHAWLCGKALRDQLGEQGTAQAAEKGETN